MTFWTPDHANILLPALGVILALAALAFFTLRRAPRLVRLIPLQLISLTLLALELQKQRAARAPQVEFDPRVLPFHFCSLFLLLLPLSAFLWGKLGERVRAVTAVLCCGVTVITYVCPYHIINLSAVQTYRTEFLGFHAVAFHLLIPLFFFLLLALDLYRPRLVDLCTALAITALYCLVGYRASVRLEANFSNLYICGIDKFSAMKTDLAARIGEAAAQRRYTHVVSALHMLFAALSFPLAWAPTLLYPKRK